MKRFRWVIAVAISVCLMGLAPAVQAGLHDVVSSDGDEIFAIPDFASTLKAVEPVRGTGVGGVKMLVNEEAAGAGPLLFPYTGESVIGPDSRYRVTATTTYPYRANALITWSVSGGTASCTGWFIGRNTVVTAGHCVNRGKGGGWYYRPSYKIYAGRNGTSAPYGYCTAKTLYSVVGWTNSGYDDYDYGVIKLNCYVGNTTGWYGFYWTSATSMNGLPAYVVGYPGDKTFGTMWRSNDSIRVTQPRRLFYANDTFGGQSGSAVYRNTSTGPYGMAIHAYGTGSTYPYTYNHGTRITQSVFNNLVYWKNLP